MELCPFTLAHGTIALGRMVFWQSESRAGRNPMFVLTFERSLFAFSANAPAFDVLFQFPPRYGINGTAPRLLFLRLDPAAQQAADLA